MSEDKSPDEDEQVIDGSDDEIPIIDENTETMEVGVEEQLDPLEEALARAEKAEKEIYERKKEIEEEMKIQILLNFATQIKYLCSIKLFPA